MAAVPRWIPAWTSAGVVFVLALLTPLVSLPADDLGLRRFQVEIDRTTTVSQSFRMTADGFEAIELATARKRPNATGTLRFELFDVTDGNVVRATDVRAAQVVAGPVYRFEFLPIDDSEGQVYRLDVRASQTPVEGAALWATKGVRYSGGTMLINERERWADLAFETFAPAARSSWIRLTDLFGDDQDRSRGRLAIGAFAAYMAALALVLRLLSPS